MAATTVRRFNGIVTRLLFLGFFLAGCGHHRGSPLKKPKGLFYGSLERLSWPVKGKVSSPFGRRSFSRHYGLDIRAAKGTKIVAAASGRVIKVGWQKGYGKTIVIRHKKLQTLYAHCNEIKVSPLQWVNKGDTLGTVGKTGNARGYHLHFEVRTLKWSALNPLDHLPKRYF